MDFSKPHFFDNKQLPTISARELGLQLLIVPTQLGRLALTASQQAAIKLHENAVSAYESTKNRGQLGQLEIEDQSHEVLIEKVKLGDASPAEAARLLVETSLPSVNLAKYDYKSADDGELIDQRVHKLLARKTDIADARWNTRLKDDPDGSDTKIHVAKRTIGTLDEAGYIWVTERRTYAGFGETRPGDITRMLMNEPQHVNDTREVVISPLITSYYAHKHDEPLQ